MRPLAVLLISCALLVPAAAKAAPDAPPVWVATEAATIPYDSMQDDAQALPQLPARTILQLLRTEGDWSLVQNPRTHDSVYVESAALAPSEPPSRYVTMPAPALLDEFEARGVVTDEVAENVYPTPNEEAADRPLNPNTWLMLTGAVRGEDGELWYRTQDGDYLNAGAVFVPERTDEFVGGWLDVDLSVPAHVTVMEGSEPIRSFLAIKGAGPRPTPTGVFTILRRVANETMNSDTIGIPRFGPGGYYLTGVLYTQYFTGDGASLHYNYWSSNWGLPGSHGCLGLTLGDSAFLWDWAHLGTPVVIHY
jgi:L,D-transpeptidase catalytic domain